MKLIINKNKLAVSADELLKRAGYAFHHDDRSDKDSYARRLGSGFFPKLHMYVSESAEQIALNLHLDQKQASYEGSNKHSGEYDGEVVEAEIARLKQFAIQFAVANINKQNIPTGQTKETTELLASLGGNRDYANQPLREDKKISWWKFW